MAVHTTSVQAQVLVLPNPTPNPKQEDLTSVLYIIHIINALA